MKNQPGIITTLIKTSHQKKNKKEEAIKEHHMMRT